MRFAGKVALVTGGSRGIGRATALRLAREGAFVVVNYRRDDEAARATVAEIEAAGGRGAAERADLEDGAAIEAMFRSIRDRSGGLDILVANAAATSFRPLLSAGAHHLDRTFAITVDGFVRCVQESTRLMEGRGGAIVAVSGFDSFRVLDGHGVLGAAKSALETLVRYFAVELAPRGIRVNAVNPGYVDTDSARAYAGARWDAAKEEWAAITPARRIARAEEMAAVIAFLCSEEASFVYGQTIVADGGLTLR